MGKAIDLLGVRFGRLVVKARAPAGINTYGKPIRKWLCVCDCGGYTITNANKLISGHTKSCGCFCREQTSKSTTVHGMRNSKEYNSWSSMKSRCLNKSFPRYELWGGRGIKIHASWINSFEQFFLDMGPRPEGTTLDRIDPNGDYTPDNCRWATPLEQSNNLNTTRYFTVLGITDTMSGFAKRWGCSRDAIKLRLRRGQSIEHIALVFSSRQD